MNYAKWLTFMIILCSLIYWSLNRMLKQNRGDHRNLSLFNLPRNLSIIFAYRLPWAIELSSNNFLIKVFTSFFIMGKTVNCASINLLENGLLSETTEEFVKHCSSPSSSQLQRRQQQRKMTSKNFNDSQISQLSFYFYAFYIFHSLVCCHKTCKARVIWIDNSDERESFDLKSFCVFIAEETIKIPILFSSANSVAEGNLI